MGDFQRRR